jgi:ubiquinone/menaquinone biosynthesis C-methylase UbiE
MPPKIDKHAALVEFQFTAQAQAFAQSPTLHDAPALALMVEAGSPQLSDRLLDVACGPGSIVAAFSPRVHEAVGLDATEAMLEQAKRLSESRRLKNTRWLRGDVYALPFEWATFDIVISRFAFHHFERPDAAFAEMVRVCRPGGRIVVCDGLAPAESAKADALNAFERLRDPSSVAFRTLEYFHALFRDAGMAAAETRFYKHPGRLSHLLKNSFPANGDRERLRILIEQSVEDDLMGLNARRDGDDIVLETPVAIISATRSAQL